VVAFGRTFMFYLIVFMDGHLFNCKLIMEKKKLLGDWTRKEFEALPCRAWDEEIEFTSMVILPTRRIHDSGYRCMDFVACKNQVPFVRLSGCSDVIHVDGIGGYGKDWLNSHRMTCGSALSSFELYSL